MGQPDLLIDQTNLQHRMLKKLFGMARGNQRVKYPSQEDILEWARPLLPKEDFEDLFLEDLIWAHTVSL